MSSAKEQASMPQTGDSDPAREGEQQAPLGDEAKVVDDISPSLERLTLGLNDSRYAATRTAKPFDSKGPSRAAGSGGWAQGQWQGQLGYMPQPQPQNQPVGYGYLPPGQAHRGYPHPINAQWQNYYAQGSYYQNYAPQVPARPYQAPQAAQGWHTAPGTLPGGGVALPTQSQESLLEEQRRKLRALMSGDGQSHPTSWSSVNDSNGFNPVLFNPIFSSPPPSPGQARGLHTRPAPSLPNSRSAFSRDEKVFTRPAPQPTKEYYTQTAMEPRLISKPPVVKQLLILDLNGALVHRPDRRNLQKVIPRPFLDPFLEYIFDTFEVMVWSSARPDNVKLMCDIVLGKTYNPTLLAKWSRDNFGLTPAEYAQNVQVYKQLTRVWADEKLCGKPSLWGQHNTILLDDTALKASAEPHNLIEIPEFKATPKQMASDDLREVAGYLDELKHQENVSAFMKRTPFKADGTWNMKWTDEMEQAALKAPGA